MKHISSHLRLKSRKLSQSLLAGNFKAAFSGRGIEFQDFRSYSYGDDAKYIDWATSSREGNIVMRRYKEEKDMHVFCVMDISENLSYPHQIKEKLQREVIEMLGTLVLQSGESFGGAIISEASLELIPPVKNPSAILKFSRKNQRQARKDQALDVSFLLSYPIKRSLVCIVSESFHIEKKSFAMASKKHDIIYIHLSSHFENTLSSGNLEYFSDGKRSLAIDASHPLKKQQYREKRMKLLQDFQKDLRNLGIDTLFLDEQSSFFSKFFLFMKAREKQNIL